MKKYIWLGLSTLIFISFQNCAPVQKNGDQSSSPDMTVSFEKVAIQDYSTLDLWDSDCNESCSGEDIEASQSKFLHIGLNGRLVESFPLDPNLAHNKVCLSVEQAQNLASIMAGAEVCMPIIPAGYYEGRVCTMQMQNAYAILDKNEAYSMELGMKSDSCSIPADLCGDKGIQLQNWTRAVVSAYRNDELAAANHSGLCD